MYESTALARYGLLLVYINVLVDQAGLPIPALPVLVACGALAAKGEISLALLLLTATLGSLTADATWFALGRWQGRRILRIFCFLSLRPPDQGLTGMERSLRRHGLASIAVAKFIPGLQTVAPPLAGALGVSTGPFILVSFLTGLAWSGGVVGIGWLFRDAISEATEWIDALGVWALVLLGLLLCCYVMVMWWRRPSGSIRLARPVAAPADTDPEAVTVIAQAPRGGSSRIIVSVDQKQGVTSFNRMV